MLSCAQMQGLGAHWACCLVRAATRVVRAYLGTVCVIDYFTARTCSLVTAALLGRYTNYSMDSYRVECLEMRDFWHVVCHVVRPKVESNLHGKEGRTVPWQYMLYGSKIKP